MAMDTDQNEIKIQWLSLRQASERLPSRLFTHLADDGSLTRRVRETCPGSFKVRLIAHQRVRPLPSEQDLLELQADDTVLARQVFLCCRDEPRVYARTIVGLVAQNHRLTARIERLGQQSLGSILFRDPLAEKLDMRLAELPLTHAFFQGAELPGHIRADRVWVRRSLYRYEGCELLVYEAFIDFDPDIAGAPPTVDR